MRKKLIVANWKSHKNPEEALEWLNNFTVKAKNPPLNTDNFEVLICPPFVDITVLKDKLLISNNSFSISLGAQDVSPFSDGSYTGAISAQQLAGLVTYCLVGHSERRTNFGENTQIVAEKIKQLLAQKIIPIVCAQTLEDIPNNVKDCPKQDLVIMFEPAKAISTGGVYKAEDPSVVQTTINSWREKLGDFQFLYGGSVNPDNAKQLLVAGTEGFVIGHASLSSDTFYQILENV